MKSCMCCSSLLFCRDTQVKEPRCPKCTVVVTSLCLLFGTLGQGLSSCCDLLKLLAVSVAESTVSNLGGVLGLGATVFPRLRTGPGLPSEVASGRNL